MRAFVGDPRARADELVGRRVAAKPRAQDAAAPPRTRRGETLQRAHGRTDEELEPDERRHRVSRQAEDERLAASAEEERLSRLDRDAPEHLLDPELRRGFADEIVGADGDSP